VTARGSSTGDASTGHASTGHASTGHASTGRSGDAALPRPAATEYADYYRDYIAAVPDGDVVAHLRQRAVATPALFEQLGEERGGFRYAPGKWSVREVLGHVVDGERLFAHRALAVARRDPGDQPSMDQDLWMAAADFDRRTLASLCAEYRAVRGATLALFSSFDAEVGARTGRANGKLFTVRSLVWIVAGHEMHHLRVLRERYGIG
jgi:uncharacterized damage-inducible protein DinB